MSYYIDPRERSLRS